MNADWEIRPAVAGDEGAILDLIRELAAYERMAEECVALEAQVRESLFGDKPVAEALLGWVDAEAVGLALYFTNFSTFLGRPGLYLEDLYVKPAHRGIGLGKGLLVACARVAWERGYGRMEWTVLDWNRPAIEFYDRLGAEALTMWTVRRLDRAALGKLVG